jgi:hypothetical protein
LKHLESNLGALEVALNNEDLDELGALEARVRGERYNEGGMQMVQE